MPVSVDEDEGEEEDDDDDGDEDDDDGDEVDGSSGVDAWASLEERSRIFPCRYEETDHPTYS